MPHENAAIETLRMLSGGEVAFRLAMTFSDFERRAAALRAAGFPDADAATGSWNPILVENWIVQRAGGRAKGAAA